jgi:tRNA_anti-like
MPNKKVILLITLFICAGAGILYAVREYNRKPEAVADTTPDFTLSSKELIDYFKRDQAAANQKFLGKMMLISGTVMALDTAIAAKPTVVIGESESNSSIRCSVDSAFYDRSRSLKPNDKITIKGVCTGYIPDDMGLGSDIIINRCIIN